LQNRPRRATNVDAKPQRRIVNSNGSAAMLEPPAQLTKYHCPPSRCGSHVRAASHYSAAHHHHDAARDHNQGNHDGAKEHVAAADKHSEKTHELTADSAKRSQKTKSLS
jgi:hypothetical protein